MRERLLRTAAGLLALALLAALLATILEIYPMPDWPGDYPHGDFTAYEADLERYSGTFGSILDISVGFICDLVPLAWLAWRGTRNGKSRLMLAGLAAHAGVGTILLVVARTAEESTSIGAALWALPLEFCWICFYLAVLASHQLRGILPSRSYAQR